MGSKCGCLEGLSKSEVHAVGVRAKHYERSCAPEERFVGAASKPHGGPPGNDFREGPTLKQERLADGVVFYTYADEAKFEFRYEIENGKLALLNFEIDASGSKNMACPEWNNGLRCQVEVPPMSKTILGTFSRQNSTDAAGLSLGFKWAFRPLDRASCKKANAAAEKRHRGLAERMRVRGILASKLKSAKAVEAACLREGEDAFIDVEFYPDDSALYKNPDDPSNAPVVWKRSAEFMHGEVSVFSDGIKASDIKQGSLGDCWFLAALAALAEFPVLIKNIFVNLDAEKHENEHGVYELLCYKNGIQTTVILDDLFPCNPQTGEPCYSHAHGNEIWVLLLEKAWAKLHGCYEQIEGGIPYRAIMDLTGGTGQSLQFRYEKERIQSGAFFSSLREFDRLGYLMCACSPGVDHMTKAKGEKPKGGIVPGHAYTLEKVQEAKDAKLLNLRNPWGKFDWQGSWSDESPLWTEEMREAFKAKKFKDDDGKFWMDDADFFETFASVDVVYYRGQLEAKWAESRTTFVTSQDDFCPQVLEFEVSAPTTGFLTLIQKDNRIQTAPDYIEMGFMLCGPLKALLTSHQGHILHAPGPELLRSQTWASREVLAEITGSAPLLPGKYMVVCFNPSKMENHYATLLVQLCENGEEANEVPSKVVRLDKVLRNQLVTAIATGQAAGEKGIFFRGKLETSGAFMPNHGYAFAARNTHTREMTVEFNFDECVGIKAVDGRQRKSVVLLPGCEMELIQEFAPIGKNGKGLASFGLGLSATFG